MKNVIQSALLATSMAVAATSVIADDHNYTYINPAIGYQVFDGDREIDDDAFWSLGLGHRYNDTWATELRIRDTDSNTELGNFDVDVMQYELSALYYWGIGEKFDPFVIFGLGHADFDGPSDNKDTQLHVGFGFEYYLDKFWSIRSEARGFLSDSKDGDSTMMLGISYAFGGRTAVHPVDTDGDGVPDSQDRCPKTPAGAPVDATGCALDSDMDGIPDYMDECPNTPAGRPVDEKGCSKVLTKTVEMTLKINFAHDSSVVTSEYTGEVAKVAEFMQRYPGVQVVIEGHTNSLGSAKYNQSLSERRANAVRNALIKWHGIDASRLDAVGYGESRLIADDSTEEGRAANRRVVAVMQAEEVEE